MSSSAHVGSLEALQRLHAAFAELGVEGREALAAAAMEAQRAIDGIRDQLAHWLRLVERRHEDVSRARATWPIAGRSARREAGAAASSRKSPCARRSSGCARPRRR